MIKNNLINIEQAKIEISEAFWFGLVAGSLLTLYLAGSMNLNQDRD